MFVMEQLQTISNEENHWVAQSSFREWISSGNLRMFVMEQLQNNDANHEQQLKITVS